MQRGIIVVGLGHAGRIRVRDLDADVRWRLRGVVSRRREVATIAWEEALSRPQVEAVVVCTENATHERLVGEALAAGKHVLVEYPLALSSAAGERLCALADERGKVLHVEEIALLSDAHARMRQLVAARGPVRSGELRFRGRSGGWSAEPDRAGFPSFAGISRLSRLVDWFGDLEVVAARLARDPTGFRLEASLRTGAGAPLSWEEERRPDASRSITGRFELAGGSVALPHGSGGGLFARDLALFTEKVGGHRPPDEGRGRVLHCLHVASSIQHACGGHAGAPVVDGSGPAG